DELGRFSPDWTCQSPAQLNLLNPDAAEFVRAVILDAIKAYDLDGVQIDLRIPAAISCNDKNITDLYSKEHDGAKPGTADDPQWRAWRAAKLTTAVSTLVAAIRNERPGLIVSALTSPFPACAHTDLADWTEWIKDQGRL